MTPDLSYVTSREGKRKGSRWGEQKRKKRINI